MVSAFGEARIAEESSCGDVWCGGDGGYSLAMLIPSRQTSRRQFLSRGMALATTLQMQRAARAAGLMADAKVCPLLPEQEVGPYYVADEMVRASLAEGRAGMPLVLRLVVLDARSCAPMAHAAVDVWHCDAMGLYSGFTKQNPRGMGGPGGPGGGPQGPPPGDFDPQHPGNRPGPPEGMGPGGRGRAGMGPPPANHPTDKLTFCRGIQMTGEDGVVQFETIFPGFYMGRTNHIHFKVRLGGHREQRTYAAGHTSHVGQVFFPEEMAAAMMLEAPYSRHQIHRTTQAEDGVYTGQEGRLSVATMRGATAAKSSGPLRADLVAAVDPTATPAPAQRAGGPPAGRGPR